MRPRKIILCVDANEQTLSQRRFLLETRGYKVLSAGTAELALGMVAAAAAFGPESIALVLTDLEVPGMDGNELARLVKRMRPEMPVMAVVRDSAVMQHPLCVDVFLPKSAMVSLLLERVRVLSARKRGPKKAAQTETVALTECRPDKTVRLVRRPPS